jgi:hypothetical protein
MTLPRYSVRTMLASVAAFACILALFKSFGISGFSVGMLASGLLLRFANLRRKQSTVLAWLTIVPSMVLCGLCFAGWLLLGYGPVILKQSWPHQLREMTSVADVDPNSVRVSGLGAFIDSEYVWRFTVDSNHLEMIQDKFGMMQTSSALIPTTFWNSFPVWWRPSPTKDMIFLTTPNFPVSQRGPDGYHYIAAYNPSLRQLFVWHKFNF